MSEVKLAINDQGLGVLSINRPKVRNALNWAAMAEFSTAVEQAHRSSDLRVLIVTGAAGAFISGGDLSELQYYNEREDGKRLTDVMGEALYRLESLQCVTIAAINGPARGGGAEVAMACDLRVIAASASVGFVHVKLGIIPAWGGGQRLMRSLGYARALELITTGRIVDAAEAMAMGLVNRVCDDAITGARDLAAQILRNPPAATRAARQVLKTGQGMDYYDALVAERAPFPDLWISEFRKKAMVRFLNRKSPANGAAQERSQRVQVK